MIINNLFVIPLDKKLNKSFISYCNMKFCFRFMVFFMFLVCSGGQWWYRYVMQGRCASAIAPPARRASYPRQARVAYTPARDTVVLHHLWKPSYSGNFYFLSFVYEIYSEGKSCHFLRSRWVQIIKSCKIVCLYLWKI